MGGLFTFGEARQIYYAGEALVHLDPTDQRAELRDEIEYFALTTTAILR